MIRIVRPAIGPKILEEQGVPEKNRAIRKHAANRKLFLKRWKADKDIYGHESVKDALLASQHGKCCYCESFVRHVSPGDIEHYRPKGAYRQSEDDELQKPGYFWLSYEWDNLLFSCENCNRRYKKNLFPLRDSSKRAIAPDAKLADEEPLLIHPVNDNPATLISYRGDTPYPIDGNDRGTNTISMLGMTNETLRSRRAKLLMTLKIMHELVKREPEDPLYARANQILQEAASVGAEYSAVVQAAIDTDFKYV